MTLLEILKDAKHGLCIRRECWSPGWYVVVTHSPWVDRLVLECGLISSFELTSRWSPLVEEVLADDWIKYA